MNPIFQHIIGAKPSKQRDAINTNNIRKTSFCKQTHFRDVTKTYISRTNQQLRTQKFILYIICLAFTYGRIKYIQIVLKIC
jgi:hypothetical protein